MSSSAETCFRPRRPVSRMWKMVAVAVFGVAAVPLALMAGSWAAGQIGDGSSAKPLRMTVPTTVR